MVSRFAPVGPRPNAVSSRAEVSDTEHYVAPISVDGAVDDVLLRARAVLQSWPRCEIVQEDNGYVRAVLTSRLFRFRDDLELDVQAGCVHVRSASRVGYSDLGANRKRVEALRTALRSQKL